MAANQTPETPETEKPKSYPFGLSQRHYRFALALLKYNNQTTAYLRIYGPDNPELTAKSAKSSAADLVRTNQNIRLFIHSRLKKYELDADNVLKKLNLAANFDLSELFDEDGHLLPPDQWGELGTVIQDYQQDTWKDNDGQVHQKITIKAMPRMAAIKEIASILRMYPDKGGLDPIEVESVMIRAYIALLSPAQQTQWKAAVIQEIARLRAQKPQPAIDITPRDTAKKGRNRKTR